MAASYGYGNSTGVAEEYMKRQIKEAAEKMSDGKSEGMPLPEIHLQAQCLNCSSQELFNAIARLEERLGCVMTPQPPTGECGQDSPEPMRSSLASQLYRNRLELDVWTARVNRIIDTLEI